MAVEQWTPIPLPELYDLIHAAEARMYGELSNLWQLVRIDPEKWVEPQYGDEGGGFWVVAICGRYIIWYNDIEEGFNVSGYAAVGHIQDYCCSQDYLEISVQRLLDMIHAGGAPGGHRREPQPVSF